MKPKPIYLFFTFFLFAFFSFDIAYAADRYWVGGTASWNSAAGTKWSLTSGGTGGEAVPTSADNCYFDGSSGSTTITVASSNTGCGNVDFTGFTGTFAGSSALTISGSLTLGASMTLTYTGTITFNSTTGTSTITSNGKTLGSSITFSGVGDTWVLGDDLTLGSTRTLNLAAGTFDANGKNVTVGVFASTNSNVRTFNMGSGQLTIRGNNTTVWNADASNNFNFINNSPIVFDYNGSTGTRTITAGILPDINQTPDFSIISGSDIVSFNTSNIDDLDFTGFNGTFSIPSSQTLYINGNLTLSPNMNFSIPSGVSINVGLRNYQDGFGFNNGVLANNGKIYGMPFDSGRILIIDPETETATTSDMGADLDSSWFSAVNADNGKIYGIPSSATEILIIDPETETATTSTMGADLSGSGKWIGGLLANNGKIYGIPSSATKILIIDPETDTATTSDMGADLTGTAKWSGGAVANNGKIYGIPSSATKILIIDPETETATTSTMGADLSGSSVWISGWQANNGKIYGMPNYSDKILIIDPNTGIATTSAMGAILKGVQKYRGSVKANNGKIYGIPYQSKLITVIDPDNNVAYTTMMERNATPSKNRYLYTNGKIVDFNILISSLGTFNLADDLVMGSSSSLYIGSGTFNTNNHNITAGSINISGVDSRTINLGSSVITLTGTSTPVWSNTLTTNQTFNPQTSSVVLNGTNQSIQGSTTFYNLTKTSTTTDTLTFDANSTQTITNTLTLQGAVDNILNLVSSVLGTQWNINPNSRSLSYLNVKDSKNTHSTTITAYNMTSIADSGNNTNWQFTAPTTVTVNSSGSTAQRRVSNLISMGNIDLAYQVAKQYNVAIPNISNTASKFTRPLYLGITGDDVKQLQIFLNSKGYIVSTEGPGSVGNETNMFGTKTKQALIKFQRANNITPAVGYFGPITRSVVSNMGSKIGY